MDVYEAIGKRHSVRQYRPERVEEEKLFRVLNAGRLAPSARNQQNWRFLVVRDADVREQLVAATGQDWAGQAPVLLAVVALAPDSVMYCGVPRGPVDCAIAIDHMTLAATAEGLGTCWIGHFDQDQARNVLHVPDDAQIIELLALGYPADQDEAPTKNRKPLQEIVVWDRFE
ncbi:MAG: nitroreductase family protein [Planctomycetota bacterium]